VLSHEDVELQSLVHSLQGNFQFNSINDMRYDRLDTASFHRASTIDSTTSNYRPKYKYVS